MSISVSKNNTIVEWQETNFKRYQRQQELLELGLQIIPAWPKTKQASVLWKEYQSERVTPGELAVWYRLHQDINYLIVMGEISGLIAVDADDEEAVKIVCRRCPDTPLKQFTSRGQHWLYRYNPATCQFGNISKLVINGLPYNIDIRTNGGVIASPLSVHQSGHVYRELVPWTRELIAAAPEFNISWLGINANPPKTELLKSDNRDYESYDDDINISINERIDQAKAWLDQTSGAEQGKGNGADKYCYRLAIKLVHGYALPPDAAEDLLLEWGEKDSNVDSRGSYYPWNPSEIRHKIRCAIAADYDGRFGDQLFVPDISDQIDNIIQPVDLSKIKEPDSEPDSEPVDTKQDIKHYSFAAISSAEFDKAVYKVEWLVNRMLVAGQPCIIGGPKKSLKTSTLIDLAISLGSGVRFLNHFNVYRKTRTLFISGESGGFTIQETARRICDAKGLRLQDTDCGWDFRLPKLSAAKEMDRLTVGIKEGGYKVVIIDPLYLCLLAGQDTIKSSNLYDMGPLFLDISTRILEAGATPLLSHHSKKNTGYDRPIELDDLSFAGVAEFARQWILINRRATYQQQGLHELYLSAGGSVGHGGMWGLDIDEGTLADDFSGRYWLTSITPMDRLIIDKKEKKADIKAENDAAAVPKLLKLASEPKSKTELMRATGWYRGKFDRIFELAKDELQLVTEIYHGKNVEKFKAV